MHEECHESKSELARRIEQSFGLQPPERSDLGGADTPRNTCLLSAWGMGVSCTLWDLANLPEPCPITHPQEHLCP